MTHVYLYQNGQVFTVQQVQSVNTRPDGAHELKLSNKKTVVVAPGWMAYTIEEDKPGKPEKPQRERDPFERENLN